MRLVYYPEWRSRLRKTLIFKGARPRCKSGSVRTLCLWTTPHAWSRSGVGGGAVRRGTGMKDRARERVLKAGQLVGEVLDPRAETRMRHLVHGGGRSSTYRRRPSLSIDGGSAPAADAAQGHRAFRSLPASVVSEYHSSVGGSQERVLSFRGKNGSAGCQCASATSTTGRARFTEGAASEAYRMSVAKSPPAHNDPRIELSVWAGVQRRQCCIGAGGEP